VADCGPSAPVPAAEFLIEHMSRTLFDPVDPTRLGALDTLLRVRVNGEIYRFASTKTMARFKRDPLRWCGVLRDPVSEVVFLPGPTTKRLDWVDGPYFFCCDSTRFEFSRNPLRYAIVRNY
jgi:YHS domain-containing protein